MKLDNVNVSCIKCIGYYVTQVMNVTGLVYHILFLKQHI